MMLALTYGAAPSIAVAQPPEPAGRAVPLHGRGAEAQAVADAQDARSRGRRW